MRPGFESLVEVPNPVKILIPNFLSELSLSSERAYPRLDLIDIFKYRIQASSKENKYQAECVKNGGGHAIEYHESCEIHFVYIFDLNKCQECQCQSSSSFESNISLSSR